MERKAQGICRTRVLLCRRRRLLVCLVAPFDDSNFNEIILCVRAVLVYVCVCVCSLYLTPSLTLPVSLTEQCCIKISLKLFANGLSSPLLSLPSLPLLCPHFVAVAFAFMRLTNRQTIWRPGTSLLPALLAPLIAFLSCLLSLCASLHHLQHCPLPPIDVRHFVVSSPKKYMFAILPLLVCLATLATPNCFARQTVLRLRQA